MSWTGNPHLSTPHLDQLAETSVRFHACFNQAPVCSPARHSINTGQYAHRHGVLGNGTPPRGPLTTMAHVFKPHGYRCFHTGHMHWAKGLDHGFEPEDAGAERKRWREGLSDFARERLNAENATMIRRTCGGPGPRSKREHVGHADKEATIAFLEEVARSGEPFLAFCPFSEPHPPFFPPSEYYSRVDHSKLPAPPQPPSDAPEPHPWIRNRQQEFAHLTQVEYRQIAAAYYGLTMMMDDFAGEVLEALERLDLRKNTIVIWASDHGEQLGEHALLTKFVTREASVHVPLMIDVPGCKPGDTHALVEHVDLLPTLCDLLGVESPETAQGRSLAPFLQAEGPPQETPSGWRDAVFSEIKQGASGPHIRMVRSREWKLNTYDGEPAELFHLTEDPGELVNLIHSDASEAKSARRELEERLRAWEETT